MRQSLWALAGGCVLLAGVGCQNFSYKEKYANGGIVEFKAGEEQSVVQKLKQEHGDIEVVGMTDVSGTAPGAFDPNAPVKRMASASKSFTGIFGSGEFGKKQLTFRVKTPTGTTPPGLPPAPNDGDLMQAGYKRSTNYPGLTKLPEPNAGAMGGATGK